MIYAYGVTVQGTYHVKNNTVCQDAHEIVKCPNDIGIAAVADGLGSEEHSDIASKIAVKIATKHCAENIFDSTGEEEILNVICASFYLAQKSIEEEAQKNEHELDQYGTTLSLAVLIHDTLYYGHAGDSGIIALATDGLFIKITNQQRDDEGRVFQLNFNEEKWVFGKVDKKVASVFLATDGMYETLFPIYIRDEKVNLYVLLARFFMDNNSLHIDEIGEDATKERIEKFICDIPDAQVNDDKTVVVLVNTDIPTELQPPAYYAEPDWAELKRKRDEAWKREAYPNLFIDDASKKPPFDKSSGDKNELGEPRQPAEKNVDSELHNESNVETVNNSAEAAKTTEADPKDKNLLSKIINRIKDGGK